MDGVTAVANVLKMEGVEWIGVMPSNPLIEAAAIAGIRPIVCRQERTGVHMADGFSRVNNGKKTGIFLAQNGPGAENAFGGVRPGLCRLGADPHPARWRRPQPTRRGTQLPPRPRLRIHHQNGPPMSTTPTASPN